MSRKHILVLGGMLPALAATALFSNLSLIALGLAMGLAGGLALEYTGVYILKLWSYGGGLPVRTLMKGWGEVGVVASLAVLWVPNFGIALLLGALFPIFLFEIPNLQKRGWEYYAPLWLVVLGWLCVIAIHQGTLLGFSYLVTGHQ